MLTCVLYLSLCMQSIQNTLTSLNREELLKFKMWFYQWETKITLKQMNEGDLLDFVDRILETLGKKTQL